MIRIIIADDHEMVRRGLRDLLQSRPDWTICGEAATGREAVALCRELKPDLVVLDLSMPELNGLEAARQIREQSPKTEILMLTMHESEQIARQALAVGVRGFVLKSDAGNVLVSAVEQVCQHKSYFTSMVSEMLLQEFLKPAATGNGSRATEDGLTPREREIVQLIAEGRSSKEIADRLAITLRTAETHRANLMRKLGVHSVSELVRYAIRNGLAGP